MDAFGTQDTGNAACCKDKAQVFVLQSVMTASQYRLLIEYGLFAKVPTLVVYVDRSHIVGCKGDVFVSADLDDVALAGYDLIEMLAVLEGYGDYLVAHAGFAMTAQAFRVLARNRD